MMKYLLINTVFCLTLMLLLPLLRNAPAKLRQWLSLSGILCWFIPWPLLQISAPSWLTPQAEPTVFYQVLVLANQSPQVINQTLSLSVPWWLMFAALAIGLALFIKDVVDHRKQLRTLQQESEGNDQLLQQFDQLPATSAKLRILSGSGAMTTGLWQPTIWLGGQNVEQDDAHILLLHEINHIHNHDNWRVCLIQLAQRLLWWNPFSYLFAKQARFFIELNCDVACTRQIPVETYRQTIAQNLLQAAGFFNSPATLATCFKPAWREGVQRLKTLEHPLVVSKGNLLATAMFVALSAALFAVPNLNMPDPTTLDHFSDQIARVGQAGVSMPVFTKRVPPVYPKSGLKQKLEGYVILEAVLHKDGTIGELALLRSFPGPNTDFDDNAIAAVKQWQFEPSQKDGEPIDVRMTLKIDFVLN